MPPNHPHCPPPPSLGSRLGWSNSEFSGRLRSFSSDVFTPFIAKINYDLSDSVQPALHNLPTIAHNKAN